VLVSDWNPLNIWFDEDCYLRFCVEEFGLDDLDDKFVHLANNSISKNSKNFSKTYTTEDGAEHEVEGNMWHSDDFIAHLQRTQGSAAVWHEWVVPQMKRIVRSSMMCVQDAVENRKNSCELFGYDFMIDEHYNPWLIEVNSSPACDYSTPTAEKIVKKGLADALKVVIDHREWSQKVRQNRRCRCCCCCCCCCCCSPCCRTLTRFRPHPTNQQSPAAKKKTPAPDTGCWTMIHDGPLLVNPVASFGSDFEVRGAKLNKAQQRKI